MTEIDTIEHVERRYHIVIPTPLIKNFDITIPEWEFRCARRNPDLATIVKLAETTFHFQQVDVESYATIYVHPAIVPANSIVNVDSRYYVKTWSIGEDKAREYPAEKFMDRNGNPINKSPSIVHLVMPPLGDGDTFKKIIIEHEDQNWIPTREEIQTSIGIVKPYLKDEIPSGWERLNAKTHSKAFPLPHGIERPLDANEVLCIQVTE